MHLAHRLLAALLTLSLTLSTLPSQAQDTAPKQHLFLPKSGSGRVVILISGQTGIPNYTPTAQRLADAGFAVTLVDGNDFWIKDTRRAWAMLKELMTQAQAAPHALPGKVGVVAFSLGGASALTYAARMPDQVAQVVTGYPYTGFIKDAADFVSKSRVPVQVFAGTADTYKDCCLIETARQLAEASRLAGGAPIRLHEYEGVGHGFNLPTANRKDQMAGEDAMERTITLLRQALPTDASRP